MSRMFKSIDKTWNVFVGCKFNCSYCNARKTAETRLRHLDRYKDGFTPHLVESELERKFKPGEFIFVAYMGDIFWAHNYQVYRILNRIAEFPQTNFLIQTKDPHCFRLWECHIPPNVHLSTTIETNYGNRQTEAPTPHDRYIFLESYPHPHKMVSIEPVMDFDIAELTRWVSNIKPEIIEVGADNYHNNLPEPPWGKVEQLLANLRNICPTVIEKDGLERLRKRR